MTVRRGFLYLGVFLVAIGGVTLLSSSGVLDPARVADALAWWPLAVIAIGVALVARGTSAAVPAGIVAAAAPGLLLGAALVAVPEFSTPCSHDASDAGTPITREGSFGSHARVSLELSCGELAVSTTPGTGWSLDARTGERRTADVVADAERLDVSSSADRVRFGWTMGADDWNVVLPRDTTLDLDAEINAGRGRLDLSDARLASVDLDVNAGDVQIDLTDASLERLHVGVNAGATTIQLPAAGGFTGDLDVNAGSLQVCVPEGLGLRVTSSAALGSIDMNGLTRDGDVWVTPGYATSQGRADLSVSASVGSVDINAEGVCK